MALKLEDKKEPLSSGSYENNELVTYDEARKSSDPEPYTAAVVTSSGANEITFILGDGRNTSDPTTRRRRSTVGDYYNGPLEPGTSYSIFQRIILNSKVLCALFIILVFARVTSLEEMVYISLRKLPDTKGKYKNRCKI